MKNQILIFAITFFVTEITAQQTIPNSNSEKGVTPQLPASTYAVVVGISDYKVCSISELCFHINPNIFWLRLVYL